PPRYTLFPYTTLFRSAAMAERNGFQVLRVNTKDHAWDFESRADFSAFCAVGCVEWTRRLPEAERPEFINDVLDRYRAVAADGSRSEEHTSELQSRFDL